MKLKAVVLSFFLVAALSCNLCLAEETWQQIDKDKYVDTQSIDFQSATVLAAKLKIVEDNGDYDIYNILIDLADMTDMATTAECYKADGTMYYNFTHDPDDKSMWKDCSNDDYIYQIMQIAAQ